MTFEIINLKISQSRSVCYWSNLTLYVSKLKIRFKQQAQYCLLSWRLTTPLYHCCFCIETRDERLKLGLYFWPGFGFHALNPLDFNSIFIRFIIIFLLKSISKIKWIDSLHHGSTDRQKWSKFFKNGALWVSWRKADVYFSSGYFGYFSLSCDITVSSNFKQTTVTVNCLKYLVVILMMDHMIWHHVMSHDVTWCIIWCILMSEITVR